MSEPIFRLPPDLVRGPEAFALPLAGEVNWGMDKLRVDALRSLYSGKGVTVGIIDTGVDRSHPLLANVVASKSFVSGESADDGNGHGSHCAGTVGAIDPRIGVGTGLTIVCGKGLSNSGSGGSTGLIRAMEWCIEQGATVLSCSWGSPTEDTNITAALKRFAEAGVWPIFAAGNSGPNTPNVDWPGRSEHCLDVAALDAKLNPASFSSSGAKIDTSGPGVNIWSVRPGGGFAQMSGTSMATPFLAGLLGIYRSALIQLKKPIPDVYDLRDYVFEDSTDVGPEGDDNRTGPGWLSPVLLALSLTPDPDPIG